MSAYWPPLENLPTFGVTVFRDAQDVVDYAVATGTANNIAGGVAGDLLYQSAPSTTAKLPIGSNTFILTSNGSVPVWTAPVIPGTPTLSAVLLAGNSAGATDINMNSQSITNANNITATTFNGSLNGTASLATNISLGNAGDLLYQSASNVTTKLGIGSNTFILTSNGTSPTWTAPPVIPGTPTLSAVLLAGNSAGATNIDMNAQSITNATAMTATTFNGALNGTIQVTDDNSATTYYPVFCTGASGQKSLLLDSTTGPLSYQPSTGTLSTLVLTVGTSPQNSFINQSTVVTQYVNNATSSQHRFYVNDATPTQINPFTITSGACTSAVPFSVSYTGGAVTTYINVGSGFLNGCVAPGDNLIVTTSGAIDTETLTFTTWSNTSSGIRINPSSLIIGSGGVTRPPSNNITFDGVGNNITLTALNCPTQTGYTVPASSDSTSKIATTQWVQSALTSGVATATTVTVADDNSATTMYPVFTTATAGQKSLLFDSTTTPLRYKPDDGILSAVKFAVGAFVNPVAGDNAGFLSQNIASVATVVQNQATSGFIHLNTFDAINSNTTVMSISTTDCTITTTNNPTITGFTAPATNDNTAKIATTSWVQSALTSGVATATTVAVADNNTATTMYPVFTTATAGQKSLLFDSSTTPLRYKPDTSELSATSFTVNGFTPVAGDNAGFIEQNTASSATTVQNQATSGRIHLAVRNASNTLSNALIITSDDASGTQFSVGNIVNPVAGNNAGFLAQNTGSSATVIQNQATSGLIRLATRDASNLLAIPLQISFSNCNITTTNDPVIYARNILVDNGSGVPITIGNGSSTSTSNIIMTSGSLASTRNFTTGENVVIGNVAGNALLVASNRNTLLGDSAGSSATGNNNICIGYNSQVPTAASNNQIAIGTASETMYVRGGFNWRIGTQITNSTNGNLSTAVLAQFYTVAMTAASQTITLPNPTTAVYLGARITFKRKTNATVFTFTAAGTTPFLGVGGFAPQASPISIAATVFQVDMVCDGVNWCFFGTG